MKNVKSLIDIFTDKAVNYLDPPVSGYAAPNGITFYNTIRDASRGISVSNCDYMNNLLANVYKIYYGDRLYVDFASAPLLRIQNNLYNIIPGIGGGVDTRKVELVTSEQASEGGVLQLGEEHTLALVTSGQPSEDGVYQPDEGQALALVTSEQAIDNGVCQPDEGQALALVTSEQPSEDDVCQPDEGQAVALVTSEQAIDNGVCQPDEGQALALITLEQAIDAFRVKFVTVVELAQSIIAQPIDAPLVALEQAKYAFTVAGVVLKQANKAATVTPVTSVALQQAALILLEQALDAKISEDAVCRPGEKHHGKYNLRPEDLGISLSNDEVNVLSIGVTVLVDGGLTNYGKYSDIIANQEDMKAVSSLKNGFLFSAGFLNRSGDTDGEYLYTWWRGQDGAQYFVNQPHERANMTGVCYDLREFYHSEFQKKKDMPAFDMQKCISLNRDSIASEDIASNMIYDAARNTLVNNDDMNGLLGDIYKDGFFSDDFARVLLQHMQNNFYNIISDIDKSVDTQKVMLGVLTSAFDIFVKDAFNKNLDVKELHDNIVKAVDDTFAGRVVIHDKAQIKGYFYQDYAECTGDYLSMIKHGKEAWNASIIRDGDFDVELMKGYIDMYSANGQCISGSNNDETPFVGGDKIINMDNAVCYADDILVDLAMVRGGMCD